MGGETETYDKLEKGESSIAKLISIFMGMVPLSAVYIPQAELHCKEYNWHFETFASPLGSFRGDFREQLSQWTETKNQG